MDWISQLSAHYKELGGVGIFLLALLKMGGTLLDWLLVQTGVNIKRKQTREDLLTKGLEEVTNKLAAQDKRLTRVESSFEVVAEICRQSADGIEKEMLDKSIENPIIMFFVTQLRRVQLIADLLKEKPCPTPPAPK